MNRSAPIAAARVAPCAMRRRARNDRCEASRSFHAALLRIHVVPLRIADGQMGRWADGQMARAARAAQHHIAKQLLAETEKAGETRITRECKTFRCTIKGLFKSRRTRTLRVRAAV
ncbi:hypothetical protein KM155_27335 [Burkholderia pseudomallei]|uniref:hypothetical protein n=1 Tax=Burkholderia pseudomallei TaxID=28450 RepID=UPI001C00EDC4|nr:hypothetical protein [Burkholderia pseudomallei]QWJ97782.1 hypothetical protein KM155_27335 [Burkholderia pseudomallei]